MAGSSIILHSFVVGHSLRPKFPSLEHLLHVWIREVGDDVRLECTRELRCAPAAIVVGYVIDPTPQLRMLAIAILDVTPLALW